MASLEDNTKERALIPKTLGPQDLGQLGGHVGLQINTGNPRGVESTKDVSKGIIYK